MYPDARVGIVLTLKCKSTTPSILFKQHGLGYPPVCEDWGYKGQGWRGTSPPPPAGAWSPRGARSWARRSPPGSWRRSPASPSPPAAQPRQAATSSSAWRSSPAPAGIVNFRYTQKMAAWKVNRYLALIGLVLGWSEVVVSRIYEISLWLIRRRCRCLHLGWRWPGYIYPARSDLTCTRGGCSTYISFLLSSSADADTRDWGDWGPPVWRCEAARPN